MIDLHSHILHGIDDGATNLQMSLDMARLAVEDGVEVMACTPHFFPGVYDPEPANVVRLVAELNDRLYAEGINLAVVAGCEAHVRPDMVKRLQGGHILPLHTSRHVLCEAPPTTLPPHMDRLFLNMISAGYTPILAHVERYRWAERALDWVKRVAGGGVMVQVTAGSFFGEYGRTAQDLALRLLGDGLVDIVASDAHNTSKRLPGLRKAYDFVAAERGREVAETMFRDRPAEILLGRGGATARKSEEAA